MSVNTVADASHVSNIVEQTGAGPTGNRQRNFTSGFVHTAQKAVFRASDTFHTNASKLHAKLLRRNEGGDQEADIMMLDASHREFEKIREAYENYSKLVDPVTENYAIKAIFLEKQLESVRAFLKNDNLDKDLSDGATNLRKELLATLGDVYGAYATAYGAPSLILKPDGIQIDLKRQKALNELKEVTGEQKFDEEFGAEFKKIVRSYELYKKLVNPSPLERHIFPKALLANLENSLKSRNIALDLSGKAAALHAELLAASKHADV